MLNSLTDEEWRKLKLPPTSSIHPRANRQLSDLSTPSFQAIEALNDVKTRERWEVAGRVVDFSHAGLCHDVCYAGLGGVQVCVVDECADGVSVCAVGGPVVEDGVQFAPNLKLVRNAQIISPHVSSQVPVNTEASDGTSDYSQGDHGLLAVPPPHQVGSTLGEVNPPPLDQVKVRNEISGGSFLAQKASLL